MDEPLLELRVDLDDAFRLVLRSASLRDLLGILERAPHAADGSHLERERRLLRPMTIMHA
jgi:hypothetical protein